MSAMWTAPTFGEPIDSMAMATRKAIVRVDMFPSIDLACPRGHSRVLAYRLRVQTRLAMVAKGLPDPSRHALLAGIGKQVNGTLVAIDLLEDRGNEMVSY